MLSASRLTEEDPNIFTYYYIVETENIAMKREVARIALRLTRHLPVSVSAVGMGRRAPQSDAFCAQPFSCGHHGLT